MKEKNKNPQDIWNLLTNPERNILKQAIKAAEHPTAEYKPNEKVIKTLIDHPKFPQYADQCLNFLQMHSLPEGTNLDTLSDLHDLLTNFVAEKTGYDIHYEDWFASIKFHEKRIEINSKKTHSLL